MKSNESATKEKTRKTAFFNIPRDWAQYLVGCEFEAVNKDGTPKLTKGKQPVRRQIDYLDLMLLDEIRSFAKRKQRDCFVMAHTLADSVGMLGQEKEICDRVLQFCALGIVIPRWRNITERNVFVVLEVNESKIEECILSRKESVLLELQEMQRNPKFTRYKYTFSDYLQEYIQEDIQENTQEEVQEPIQEGTPKEFSVGFDFEKSKNEFFEAPNAEKRRAVRKQ